VLYFYNSISGSAGNISKHKFKNKQAKITKNLLQTKLNILICPLDWGLGHATRCVPIVRHLIRLKCNVIIAGSGRSLDFLKQEFQECSFIHLPSYRFKYSNKGLMTLAMLLSTPMIFYGIYKEHQRLKIIVRQHRIDGVISDNRFGLWSDEVPCVYITHQVKIRPNPAFKFSEPLLHNFHRYFITKYDWLWIPDMETEPTLSGELAHHFSVPVKHRYVGPLSRFAGLEQEIKDESNDTGPVDILAIISGPEPQRSIFESMILEQAETVREKIILLQGIPGRDQKVVRKGNLTIYPHLETPSLKNLIDQAGIVLCRPGYSSVMDLAVLGKKAFFVPTPGQTEQEYLAEFLSEKGLCNFVPQHAFKLAEVIKKSASFKGFGEFQFTSSVEQAVDNFVDHIYNKD
jgi:uncharacterized protein (TIGR00661 family)